MPKEAYGVAACVAAILGAFFLATYSGPYRLVADLQVAWFHTNIVALSFAVTMALAAAPLMGLVYVLERRMGTRETWFTPIWNDLDRIFDLPPGKTLLVGITIGVMGSYFCVKDLGRGPLTPLSVRDLEDGQAPRSTFVELTDGKVLEETSLTFKSNSTVHRYVPVVDHAARAVLFLRVSEHGPVRDAAGRIKGVLDVNDMEGELRSRLAAANAIAATHYVLGVGRTPSPEVGAWMAAVGMVISLFGLAWWRLRYGDGRERAAG